MREDERPSTMRPRPAPQVFNITKLPRGRMAAMRRGGTGVPHDWSADCVVFSTYSALIAKDRSKQTCARPSAGLGARGLSFDPSYRAA